MQLVRYNPARDVGGVEKELDKLLAGGWPVFPIFPEDSTVDMYTEENRLVLEVVLPTFKKEEIKVSANDDYLEITARHEEKEEKNGKRDYLLHESSRSYHRCINLPAGVDADEVSAHFEGGKLLVTMPFEAEKKAKEVAIT